VLVPLGYYARGGGSDERFAWRMFSTLRMQRCQVRIDEAADRGGAVVRRAVHLPSELSSVWIGLLRSERPQVVAKFLRRRCESAEVSEVFYSRTCSDTDGRALPPRAIVWDCARGEPRDASGGE
jgi:hypothetical protein